MEIHNYKAEINKGKKKLFDSIERKITIQLYSYKIGYKV